MMIVLKRENLVCGAIDYWDVYLHLNWPIFGGVKIVYFFLFCLYSPPTFHSVILTSHKEMLLNIICNQMPKQIFHSFWLYTQTRYCNNACVYWAALKFVPKNTISTMPLTYINIYCVFFSFRAYQSDLVWFATNTSFQNIKHLSLMDCYSYNLTLGKIEEKSMPSCSTDLKNRIREIENHLFEWLPVHHHMHVVLIVNVLDLEGSFGNGVDRRKCFLD